MIHDFKFAFRQLLKAPGFTVAAVIVLALGIGANSAVFSLVNTLFFAPPAYARPHELVQVFSQDTKSPKTYRGFSYPTYRGPQPLPGQTHHYKFVLRAIGSDLGLSSGMFSNTALKAAEGHVLAQSEIAVTYTREVKP